MPITTLLLALFACAPEYKPNQNKVAPTAAISSPGDASTFETGELVTLVGSATDPQDDTQATPLTIKWYAGDDTEICPGSTATAGEVTCDWIAEEGVTRLRLWVMDSTEETDEDEISITVTPNLSPSITIVTPLEDGEYYADLPIDLNATVSDPESDASALLVTWTNDADEVVAEVSAVSSGTASTTEYLTEGTHTLKATVKDPSGKENVDSVTVVVHGANTAPDCEVTAPLNGDAFALGDTVLFTGVATDAETAATDLVLELTSSEEPISDGDVVPVDSDGDFTYAWVPTVPGTHIVTLTCTDSLDEGHYETLTIEVCDTLWYYDGDNDGTGDPDLSVVACDRPDGYAATGDDCVDSDADIGPGAAEEDSFTACMRDEDGDGYGDANVPAEVTAGSDCDDDAPTVNPAATEVCDGLDNDCDGTEDGAAAADATTWYADADADGYGNPATSRSECSAPVGYVADRTDCDDTTALRAPDATELCDGLDNDCDSVVDPDTSADVVLWYRDGDSDGAGDSALSVDACDQPTGYAATGGDCVDSDADIGPGAAEEDSRSACMQDEDGDGWGDANVPAEVTAGSDCDDDAPTVNPAAAEVCDGLDNDCDGTEDGADAADATSWYADADADGYGNPATSRSECSAPAGYVADRTDCDDTTARRAPDATELCDGLDNDCDSVIDPDSSADAATWYRDRDGDGSGDPDTVDISCVAATDYVSDADDCDDFDDAINPYAAEACNRVDDNCDGLVDEEDAAVDCNEPPAITSVSLSPDPAYAGDAILCTPAGWSDADGDTEDYTYSWTVDGAAVAETSALLTEDLIRKQLVRCTATPWDGSEYGTARSDSLRISNSPPRAPVVAISPSSPSGGEDDLVCEITADAVDPDGDSVTYTFAWTVDGMAYGDAIATSYADDTVPVEDAYADEVWTCSVIATDGDDASAAGTDSVTLGDSAQDGATPTRAGLSCDQIESDWPDSYNADYWVYPGGDTAREPALEVCIFDNHTRVFAYSGSLDSWTVPSGVAYVTVTAWGGGGALGTQGIPPWLFNGGDGGTTVGTLPATPGDVLTVVVGQGGIGAQAENTFTASADPGLMGGGGQGAPSAIPGEDWTPGGGGGGGYSGVFSGSPARGTTLVLAGGGGGGGGGGAGGDGGGLAADDGTYFFTSALTNVGGGGTQSRGGTATIGVYYLANGAATTPVGAALYGGSGSYVSIASVGDGGGGGGGGGYYGGGGGYSVRSDAGGGGGGGSGFVATTALTSALTTGLTATDDPDYDGTAGEQGTYTSSGPVSGGDGDNGLIVIRY